MRVARSHLTIVVATVVLAAVAAALALRAPVRFGSDMTSPALQIAIAFVLTFLVVLIVRYVLLLWLGYLQHIENRGLGAEDAAQPPVTIVVPVFDEESVIEAALRSLLELRYPAFHVIVVDDGSRDRTFARASALAGRYGACTIRVLRKRNGGKASALNVGIANATTEYVLCMDGDSRLHPDTLRFAMRHFAVARVGAVAGNV
jgi:cellulose synthase/poly-beta-1,6-N-acetylglucosamine synthase-like glycosyltransferase